MSVRVLPHRLRQKGVRMRAIRWTLAGLFLGVMVAGSVSPASAGFTENTAGCTASGSFREGKMTVDASTVGDRVVTVPRKDTVDWQGSVSTTGTYSGEISIKLPWGTKQIDSWSGNSTTTSSSNSEEYDLPKLLPGGVEFRIEGTHTVNGQTCKGYVRMKLAGKPLSSPITWVALAGTVGTGAGIGAVVWPMFRRVTR